MLLVFLTNSQPNLLRKRLSHSFRCEREILLAGWKERLARRQLLEVLGLRVVAD
jgi:hypothetical protein